MNIKGKLKTLAAAFLAVVGMLAPFGAWAVDGEWSPEDSNGTSYKITGFESLSDIGLSRPDKHPGESYTYFVSSSLGPAYSPAITQLCYMNYDAWAEKEMFHLGKKGGGKFR